MDDLNVSGGFPPPPQRARWSRKAQYLAAGLWSSFLAACLATMLFFAFVDPQFIGDAMTPAVELSRMTGYGIGFFFFWFITGVSSVMSIYLVTTSGQSGAGHHQNDGRRE